MVRSTETAWFFYISWYDYGWRQYDPALGRWHVPDPLAEYHYNMTPYNYCLNNPVRFIDPFGLDTTYVAPVIEPVVVVGQKPPPTRWQRFKSWLGRVLADDSSLEGRGDTQPAGSVFTKEGGGASPTKTEATEEIYGTSNIEDFLAASKGIGKSPTYSKPSSNSKKVQNVIKGGVKTVKAVQTTDKAIKQNNTGGDNTTGTGIPISNVVPGSNPASDPVVDVVTQWGSPDSAGVWIRKDSLSNGKVTYSKQNINNTSEQKSNKNEFQRAWNNW